MVAVLDDARRLLPGLGLLVAVAVLARAVGRAVPGVSPLVVAIALGALLSTTAGVPTRARPGVERHGRVLEAGIVLLGARLTLDELVRTGPTVVALATAAVAFGVLWVELLARGFGLRRGPRALLAAGASVCGVSAIVAVAGCVDADEADVSYAVGTVLLFDAVTLLVYPLVGTALGLADRTFGVWAGLTLFSTGPTAAVGFAVSDVAGRWATVTKLVRNAFIGVLAVAYAVRHARHVSAPPADEGGAATGSAVRNVWRRFPRFILGFLAVAAVANLGVLSAATQSSLATATDWLFTVAFVGLGIDLDPGQLRRVGLRPVLLVAVHLLTVSALALLVVRLLL